MGPTALIAVPVRVWTARMTTRATTSRPATRPHDEAPRQRTVVQRHLAAALHAVGGSVPLLATVTVYAALHLLWSLVPVTGMPGAADVALPLVLTSLGAPSASTCAGVVAVRLLDVLDPGRAGRCSPHVSSTASSREHGAAGSGGRWVRRQAR